MWLEPTAAGGVKKAHDVISFPNPLQTKGFWGQQFKVSARTHGKWKIFKTVSKVASFDNVRVLKRINVPERKRKRLEYINREVLKARLCRQGLRQLDYDVIWFLLSRRGPILALKKKNSL